MKYQSGWDVLRFTMMATLGALVIAVPVVAWANGFDSKKRDDIETQNYLAVDGGKLLCKNSSCAECGLFEYVETAYSDTKRVVYRATLCELNWQNEQAVVKAKKVDREIRAKYDH